MGPLRNHHHNHDEGQGWDEGRHDEDHEGDGVGEDMKYSTPGTRSLDTELSNVRVGW